MELSVFLAITQFLATCLSQLFTGLDAVTVVDAPKLTFLDCIIVPAIMGRLYAFYLFLMGQEVDDTPIDPEYS